MKVFVVAVVLIVVFYGVIPVAKRFMDKRHDKNNGGEDQQ